MTFAEKIQHLRKEKVLSQDQLAMDLGISRQSVSKWELGDSMPDIGKVLQLADYFQVSTDYLLREEIDDINSNFQPGSSATVPAFDINSDNPTTSSEPISTNNADKNPFHRAFKISLWITLIFAAFPFVVTLLAQFFPSNGARLGHVEFLLLLVSVFSTIVPIAGVLTIIFWILKCLWK